MKSELLPKSIPPVKISWHIFFCGFRGGNEKFAEIRAGSLSRHRSILRSQLRCVLSVLQREPARKKTCKIFKSRKISRLYDIYLNP